MRGVILLLVVSMAATVVLASGVALAMGGGSAGAHSSVVGPGESIQKTINAAHPGDTIVVKGVHKEDVIIRKDGIKLRGIDNATLEPPAKADSRCSRFYGQAEGICVLGEVDLEAGKLTGPRVSDVSISGFTFRGFKIPSIELTGTRDATLTKNRALGSGTIGIGLSVGTKILSNVVRAPEGDGIGVEKSRDVTVVGNDVKGSPENALFMEKDTNFTVGGNDFTDNKVGMVVIKSTGTKILSNDIMDSTLVGTVILESTGTKILSNHISRSGDTGIVIFGPDRANTNAKVVANNISGGGWGIYVGDVTKGGSIAANTIRNNCAGMFFEADQFKEHVVGFEVRANTVKDNTRSCRAAKFDRNVSGIGIALLGAASGMELTANHLSGNVPSGPTRISGGVVVSKDPYSSRSPKPTNNSVMGNHFGHNKPDIYWDKSGSGNRFLGNLCNRSVPSSLCN